MLYANTNYKLYIDDQTVATFPTLSENSQRLSDNVLTVTSFLNCAFEIVGLFLMIAKGVVVKLLNFSSWKASVLKPTVKAALIR
ncbi:hypothetical protein [Furfurilactobacillus milii]|uniref:Uncharacterized protein n=1 Tax=Furfurilactobacillus milii TaxID=2888272 RepID=A0A6N9I2V9_9LACO|nr:hypothetical protein [Furfurilactobacillus milii]MYV17290.1 hypothetical protein [Furfurilactobacillus milii]